MATTSTNRPAAARLKAIKNAAGPTAKNPSRKTLQSVDTNLNSYDRTDPFFAFNALLKLLGSLPSRIGGCHLKLTPEEHKLSLHLLTIVEPFVGLAPSRRTITRQPTEILDAIVFHVDAKCDLLALALSCKRMHGVVYPRHYDYRVIRCKVSSLRVWNNLIVHRSLAKNVRRLEILDERSSEPEAVPPGILTSDTDLESTDDELGMHAKQERYLVAALTRMVSLQSFSWSCNHSPISIDHVWPTLLKCHSLKEIEINDNLIFGPSLSDTTDDGVESRKSRRTIPLRELTNVALKSTKHIYGATKQPVLGRISGMLTHCPNLESLDIAYNHPRAGQNGAAAHPVADEFLMYSRWPSLTTLSLTNLRCSPITGFDAASAFLGAHHNLQVLHLDITGTGNGGAGAEGSLPRLVLPDNSLPRLRELHANKEIAAAVLTCPCDAPRPLDTLRGVRLAGAYAPADTDHHFLASLRAGGAAVRRVELAGWGEMEDLRRLVEAAPGLTWLDVGKRGAGGSPAAPRERGAALPVANTAEWAALLAGLPELAAFHGVHFFYEVSPQAAAAASSATGGAAVNLMMTDRSRMRKNDEIASVLAWKCAKLRRLDHWEENGGKVIVLVRDGEKDKDKVRWEVRRAKQ